jgi:hypothetical protein
MGHDGDAPEENEQTEQFGERGVLDETVDREFACENAKVKDGAEPGAVRGVLVFARVGTMRDELTSLDRPGGCPP